MSYDLVILFFYLFPTDLFFSTCFFIIIMLSLLHDDTRSTRSTRSRRRWETAHRVSFSMTTHLEAMHPCG